MTAVTCPAERCGTVFQPLMRVVIDAGEDCRPSIEVSFAHLEQHVAGHVAAGEWR